MRPPNFPVVHHTHNPKKCKYCMRTGVCHHPQTRAHARAVEEYNTWLFNRQVDRTRAKLYPTRINPRTHALDNFANHPLARHMKLKMDIPHGDIANSLDLKWVGEVMEDRWKQLVAKKPRKYTMDPKRAKGDRILVRVKKISRVRRIAQR